MKIVNAGLEVCHRVIEGYTVLNSSIWTRIVHGVWGSRPFTSNPDEIIETRKLALDGAFQVMEIAAEYGVTICLEIVNRYEMYYLNTVDDGIDFCTKVNSPFCKLLLDTYHMSIEEDQMIDSVQKA
ncbi:TIM barrel protein [uncultured Oscillibacter sp.]|uniref:TIM barrel protein n=1 Tax=uncultured Oscillibacter sp. TaxID=876091 RepID=UPI00351EE0CD